MWEKDKEYLGLENYETEYGKITLEPVSSDRGRWRCTNLFNPGKHLKILSLIPLYFFDEKIAKSEIERWLNLAKEFVKLKENPEIRFGFLAEKLSHGKHCIVTVGRFVNMPNELFGGQYVAVTVPANLEPWLMVDVNDDFPRLYISPDSAQLEAEEWMRVRGEKTNYSSWEYLV